MAGAACGTGNAYPTGAPDFTPGFMGVRVIPLLSSLMTLLINLSVCISALEFNFVSVIYFCFVFVDVEPSKYLKLLFILLSKYMYDPVVS